MTALIFLSSLLLISGAVLLGLGLRRQFNGPETGPVGDRGPLPAKRSVAEHFRSLIEKADRALLYPYLESDRTTTFAPVVILVLFLGIPLLATANGLLIGSPRLMILCLIAYAGLGALVFLVETPKLEKLAGFLAGAVALFFMALLPIYVWRSLTDRALNEQPLEMVPFVLVCFVLLGLSGYGVFVLGRVSRVATEGLSGMRSVKTFARALAFLTLMYPVLMLAPVLIDQAKPLHLGLFWANLLIALPLFGLASAFGWHVLRTRGQGSLWKALTGPLAVGILAVILAQLLLAQPGEVSDAVIVAAPLDLSWFALPPLLLPLVLFGLVGWCWLTARIEVGHALRYGGIVLIGLGLLIRLLLG
ncbi:MAG: hypothetical protein ACPGOV_09870 [Magnetovibrionaceae bacterium]